MTSGHSENQSGPVAHGSKPPVTKGTLSDPYLMTGYDKKSLSIRSSKNGQIDIQIDISGNGDWVTYLTTTLSAQKEFTHTFPESFNAYWVRFQAKSPMTVTTQLTYQ